jgi:hypothetical protein
MQDDSEDGVCLGGSLKAEGLGDGCVAGFQPAIRGRDALDTKAIPKLRLRLPPDP